MPESLSPILPKRHDCLRGKAAEREEQEEKEKEEEEEEKKEEWGGVAN